MSTEPNRDPDPTEGTLDFDPIGPPAPRPTETPSASGAPDPAFASTVDFPSARAAAPPPAFDGTVDFPASAPPPAPKPPAPRPPAPAFGGTVDFPAQPAGPVDSGFAGTVDFPGSPPAAPPPPAAARRQPPPPPVDPAYAGTVDFQGPGAPRVDMAYAGTADFTPPGPDDGTEAGSQGGRPRAPVEGTMDHAPSQDDADSAAHSAGTGYFDASQEGGAVAPEEQQPATPRLTFDGPRYDLKKMHARGGMGEVWLAEDSGIGRVVALKKMRQRMKGKEDQFFWEGQVTGQLEHPGVVPVYELGLDAAGDPYYVMKFVHGKTLQEELEAFHAAPAGRPTREFERARLIQIFVAICNTLAYAHNRGIIHRDMKPENVMIGDYGETFVLDWGLAKISGRDEMEERGAVTRKSYSGETHETMAGSIKGTAAYMAPESATGDVKLIDQISDVYLLGATLYHVITGKPPREAKKLHELLAAAHQPPIPPLQHDPTIPKPLAAICLKAMAVERAARYESAKAMAADLQRYLAGEPVTAYQETFAERAWRWARRHRKLLSRTAAAVLVLAAAGVAFAQVRAIQRENARKLQEAEDQRRAEADEAERERLRIKAERDEANRKADDEERKGKVLARQKQAGADLKRFRVLAEEMRFLAANTHPSAARAPYFDPKAGLVKGREALAIADPWGPALADFALDADRPALAQDLYDLLLLMAQVRNQAGGPEAGTEALALLARAEKLRPGTRSLYRLRGQALAALGKADESAQAAKKAETAPLTAADHFLLGELARVPATRPEDLQDRAGKFQPNRAALEQAVTEYRLALQTEPGHYWANYQLGRCLLGLGQSAEGVQALGACVALKPESPWGYGARGVALISLKRYGEAAADLNRAIELDPGSRQHRLNRGVLAWTTGDAPAALQDFDAVLAPPAEGRLLEAAFYKANVLGEQGKFDEAVAAAGVALSGTAPVRPAYLLRAQINFVKGRDAEGLDDLNSFLGASDPGFDPKSAAAAGKRGRQLWLIAQAVPAGKTADEQIGNNRVRGRMYRLAAAELQSAADHGGATAGVLEDLGRVHELLGRANDAIRAYSQALDKLPDEPATVPDRTRVRVLRGWAWTTVPQPDLAKAKDDFAAALKLSADNAEAHTGLGYVEACTGNGSAARREAQAAVLYGSGDYLILHNVACVFAKLSDTEAARAGEFEDTALDYLRRGIELWKRDKSGPNALVLVRDEPAFQRLRKARAKDLQALLAE